MKLFVAGLPYDVDDQELQEMFETYGTVGSARVILDRETRKSRGFGFVEFANDDEAKELWSARKEALWSVMAMKKDESDHVWTTDVVSHALTPSTLV